MPSKKTNGKNATKKKSTTKKTTATKKTTTAKTVTKQNTNNKQVKKQPVKKEAKVIEKKETVVDKKKTSKKNKIIDKIFQIRKKNNEKDSKIHNSKWSKIEKLLDSKKVKKRFIIIAFICLFVIILEGIFFLSYMVKQDKKTIHYDMLNGVGIEEGAILAVGQSDFRYSKENNYTKGTLYAKFIKYDSKGKIIFEKPYKKGINTNFNSIIPTSDGYVVVGSGVFSDKEVEDEGKEAIIIKYDKEGNIVWEKFYSVITATIFNKVIEVSDGYVAIGQSIYANMEMGNHTTGGGIIVKYDKNGNEVWHNNHGGTKSGNFNDIVSIGTDFYVVGKDGTDSGNIVKFNSEGQYVWHKNYRYTDTIGFTGVAYLDSSLYVVGSKKILPDGVKDEDNRDTTNTDCLLVKYDLEGNILFEKTFGGSSSERYNSVISYQNNLYVVGHTTSTNAGFKIQTDGKLLTGIVVRYDKEGNILRKVVYGGSNNETLTDIVTDGISLYVSGYSNSKNSNIDNGKDNGRDYFGKVIKSDLKFRTLMIK